jgi:hypothetical protein
MKCLKDENWVFWESIGFDNKGEDEWESNGKWVFEYAGTKERPHCWRIDDFNNEGHQMIFIDIMNKKELKYLLHAINIK